MSNRVLIASAGAVLLVGCVTTPPPQRITQDCAVGGSRNWTATLDAMPGPGKTGPTLTITGEVDLPTPGYQTVLIAGPADRMMPPSQRFRLESSAPGGMVAQVVTPTPVTYRATADYPAYRAIVIQCGDRSLATITDVAVVH